MAFSFQNLERFVSKLRTPLVLAAMAFALAGCEDDPLGVNSGDPLTESEMQAVFFAISDAFSNLNFAPAASGPARTTISVNESFSGTAPCAVDGTMDANGCVVSTESRTVTLDVISGSETGGIAFTSSDGRAGSCAFDVQFSGSFSQSTESGSSSVSGTVCGTSDSGLRVIEIDSAVTG